jgi:DNA-binding NarL/FixJ family response regulator
VGPLANSPNTERVRILVATPDIALARAVAERLDAHGNLEVVATVESWPDALLHAHELRPDVVVVDTGQVVTIVARERVADSRGCDHRAVAYVRRDHAVAMIDVAVGLYSAAPDRRTSAGRGPGGPAVEPQRES